MTDRSARHLRPHYPFMIAVAGGLLCPSLGIAQTDSELSSELQACRAIEDDRVRLSCLDRVLAEERASPGSAGRPAPEDENTAESDPNAEARSPNPPLEAETPPNERVTNTVTIVAVHAGLPGAARFVTADGRVFTQRSGSARPPFPSVPFQGTVERRALGGRFLTLEDGRRFRVISNE